MGGGASRGEGGARERVVDVAMALLVGQGRDAVSTRAVCAAAGVQAPTLYRLFGDKRGLLDAVAARGLTTHVHPGLPEGDDPVADLRRGWDAHVGFGLANPYLYSLVYGEPRPGAPHPGAAEEEQGLLARVRAAASAGRLTVGEDVAAALLTAGAIGTTLCLLSRPQGRRDPGVSSLAREAVLAATTRDAPPWVDREVAGAAVTLRALLPRSSTLSAGERHLMGEWLERLAEQA